MLQNVQEAYASLIGLPLIMIDSAYTSLTSVSNADEFSELIMFSESKDLQKMLAEQWEDYLQLTSPTVIDLVFPGAKGIITPVIVEEQVYCFILAGPFIITGSHLETRRGAGDKERWNRSIMSASKCSLLDIQARVRVLEKMSHVCARLVEGEKRNKRYLHCLRSLHEAVGYYEKQQTLHITSYLRIFCQFHPYIHFAAYAKRIDEKRFVIEDITTEQSDKKWLGTIYTTDHPIMKYLVERREPLYLENVSAKFEFADWMNKENELKTLFIYPLTQNDSISGAIFVGSKAKARFGQEIKESGHLLAKLFEMFLSYQYNQCNRNEKRYLSALESLNDMCKVMNMMNNVDEILHMAAHLALEFAQSDFSAIFLNHPNERKVITDTANSSYRQFHHYYDTVWSRYFQQQQDFSSASPNVYKTGFGIMMEFPFYIHKHIQGVLAVHVIQTKPLKEIEAYLSLLTTMLTFILQRVMQPEERGLSIQKSFFSELLTSREMDVLKYIVQGYSNREIAEKLYISVHTVKNHITNIFQKLGVTDRSQVIAMVYQLNYGEYEWK
nr:response regulator transcription factor [Anoxybacillus caldiproteolyticus]